MKTSNTIAIGAVVALVLVGLKFALDRPEERTNVADGPGQKMAGPARLRPQL